MPVREGLARLEGVESISERCNRKESTGELRMRNGRLVDPNKLAQQVRDIRVGARLRGLEATVNGMLEQIQGKPHLRITGSNELLTLAALTQKVQTNAINKTPLAPSRQEQEAFNVLIAKSNGKAVPVRVTGPLRKPENSSGLILEVREFRFVR